MRTSRTNGRGGDRLRQRRFQRVLSLDAHAPRAHGAAEHGEVGRREAGVGEPDMPSAAMPWWHML
jgi:hypothetical protein